MTNAFASNTVVFSFFVFTFLACQAPGPKRSCDSVAIGQDASALSKVTYDKFYLQYGTGVGSYDSDLMCQWCPVGSGCSATDVKCENKNAAIYRLTGDYEGPCPYDGTVDCAIWVRNDKVVARRVYCID